MGLNYLELNISNEGTRNDVRMRVVEQFSLETPGLGKGELASKYIYYVETLFDGRRVYLQRPANLKNGYDFKICVEDWNYANPGERFRNAPKHDDIYVDLLNKREENYPLYCDLYRLLQRIYNCEDVSDNEMYGYNFSSGLPVDHICKVIKWLFIEQDIRYWNYSGRAMTWGRVPDL